MSLPPNDPEPADESLWDAAPDETPQQDASAPRAGEEPPAFAFAKAFAELMGDDEEEPADAPGEGPAGEFSRPMLHVPPDGEAEESDPLAAEDLVAEDRGEVSPRGILEAMLFVGSPDNQPLSAEEVARLIRGVEPDEVDALVAELNAHYAETGSPYEIASEGLGYRLVLKPAFHAVRDKFYGKLRETRLSQAAVEVLAVVAYHEPLTVHQVNELRGASSSSVLSQLVRRQLLRLDRGTDKTQPPKYSTTRRFLDLFGLESLADLPRSQDVDQW